MTFHSPRRPGPADVIGASIKPDSEPGAGHGGPHPRPQAPKAQGTADPSRDQSSHDGPPNPGHERPDYAGSSSGAGVQ